MHNQNILISGAGIAGTTLAFWLKRFGFNPTIVESAPALREGGYAIDFWGAGFDVAERMGILAGLRDADLNIEDLAFVDEKDRRKSGLNYGKIIHALKGRGFSLLRSSLAKTIYHHLPDGVEIIFGSTITHISQEAGGVSVKFSNGATRVFDLVVGADGLHSNVRKLIFGDEAQFEKFFNYYTASYTVAGKDYGDREFKMYNVPDRQAAVYSTNDRKMTVFYVFKTPDKLTYDHHDLDAQKRILFREFGNIGWKCPELLSGMERAPDFYFDVVSQIEMENWSKGRVTLVGDACACPSLLSGQGSTLAMVGSYILAGELKNANGDHQVAFGEYQKLFKPFIDSKQKLARKFAKSFVSGNNFGIWLRNAFVKMMGMPFLTKLFVRQFTDHRLKLKNYETG